MAFNTVTLLHAGSADTQMLSNLLIGSMASASIGLLQAGAGPGPVLCTRIKQLLEKLLSLASTTGASAPMTQELATSFGVPVAGALLPSVTRGQSSSEGSDLLAALIDAFGTDVAAAPAPAEQPGARFARGAWLSLHIRTTSLLTLLMFFRLFTRCMAAWEILPGP